MTEAEYQRMYAAFVRTCEKFNRKPKPYEFFMENMKKLPRPKEDNPDEEFLSIAHEVGTDFVICFLREMTEGEKDAE
jgi:hypothetical protein|nr:MAG TPA: hypothetical protein [Caudoviricetes sp.]